MAPLPPSRSLLRDPAFLVPWLAAEFSFLGMQIHMVAASWLMTQITASPLLVSLIQTAYALPMVLFSLLAGALADTVDRRSAMIWSLSICSLGSFGLVAIAAAGLLTPWWILCLIFVVGVGVALFTPAWQATLGDIAPREQLVEAVSLHNLGANAMRTIGPALGGVLVAGMGAMVTFLAGAATYLPMLLIVGLRPLKVKQPKDRESIRMALVLGMRYLTMAPHLELLLLRSLLFAFSGICAIAMLPLVAQVQYGGSVSVYGLLYSAYGLGAIFGGLLLKRLRQRFSMDNILSLVFIGSSAALAGLSFSSQLWQGLICAMAAGAAWLVANALHNSALQLSTPRWLAGRIVATFMAAVCLGMALGGWVWGAVAGHLGSEGALLGASLAGLLPLLLARRHPLPSTPAHDLEPLEETSFPADDRGYALSGGPLYIVFDHDIDPSETAAFLSLMAERRRHITQLGGSHWMLLRDIRSAGRWTESFYTASWPDYRRMMARRSAETAHLRASLARLQRSAKEPAVRLMLYEAVNRRGRVSIPRI